MLIGVRKNKSIEKKNNQVLGSIKIRGIWKKEHDIDFSPTDFLAHLIYECKLPISKRGIIGTLSTHLSIYLTVYFLEYPPHQHFTGPLEKKSTLNL